jgi:methylated-DNA-[protein]-cysteine S-methyltransferase
MQVSAAYYSSPIGLIELTASASGIATLYFVEEKRYDENSSDPFLKECLLQLHAYFNEGKKTFDVALDPAGTEFQLKVWKELLHIPFGETISYLDLALAMGDRNATRAVGSANGKNPISLIVPCHRVIGNDGKLTGYGGGLWRKEWLLKHEGSLRPEKQISLFGEISIQ